MSILIKVYSSLNLREFVAHFEYDGMDIHLFEVQWNDTREAMPEATAVQVLGSDVVDILYGIGYEKLHLHMGAA